MSTQDAFRWTIKGYGDGKEHELTLMCNLQRYDEFGKNHITKDGVLQRYYVGACSIDLFVTTRSGTSRHRFSKINFGKLVKMVRGTRSTNARSIVFVDDMNLSVEVPCLLLRGAISGINNKLSELATLTRQQEREEAERLRVLQLRERHEMMKENAKTPPPPPPQITPFDISPHINATDGIRKYMDATTNQVAFALDNSYVNGLIDARLRYINERIDKIEAAMNDAEQTKRVASFSDELEELRLQFGTLKNIINER